MIDVFPLEPWAVVTSGFGPRWGRMHRGTDYGSPNPGQRTINGTPVRAPFDGTLTTGNEPGGAGLWSNVTAADGRLFKSFHHRWYKRTSGRVTAGDVIAYVGSTGASTGPHAHLELWVGGRPIDPQPYLEDARRRATQPPIPPAPVPEEDDVTPEQMDTLGRWMQEQAANVIASTNTKIDALAWGIVAGNVKVLEAVNKAAAGGGQVDVDAIAAEVADEIAQRMQG